MPNSSLCVDASLVVRLLIDTTDTRLPERWLAWAAEGMQVVAPALLMYEVTNALYQYQKLQFLGPAVIHQALDAALALPIRLLGDADLHPAAVRLAERFGLPATYDAHYLALADRLGIEFWTADRRLARAVGSELPWVHLLP